MRSIRGRTLLLVLSVLSLALSLISYRSYRDAQHEIEELFDAQLVRSARLVGGMLSRDTPAETQHALQRALDAALVPDPGSANDSTAARALGHEYESKLGFVVYAANGSIVLQSASISAPEDALQQVLRTLAAPPGQPQGAPPAPRVPLSSAVAGYHDITLDGHGWRVFVLHDTPNAQWVLVGEREDVRGELVEKIALRSLLPDLIGLPVLALLVWLAIGWGLRPLARMAQLLKARDADNLAPLLLAPLPQELEPVAASLNRLLTQITTLLEREKRFIADAAHELRTPLAVLRIHAQNALQAADVADRNNALKQLDAAVERATRVVAQLLTLARLEPSAIRLAMQPLDLAVFARNELAELIPLALSRHQELALEVAEGDDPRLQADAPSLSILLQNLISNAVQHTPAAGEIRVLVCASADSVTLQVQDSGPGIAPALRSQVFKRFFRQGDSLGAGLGLSIVTRIVELHDGTITLGESPLGGLDVTVRLPKRHPPSSNH